MRSMTGGSIRCREQQSLSSVSSRFGRCELSNVIVLRLRAGGGCRCYAKDHRVFFVLTKKDWRSMAV